MLNLKSLSKLLLCSRCLQSYNHSKRFQTASGAISYHEAISALDETTSQHPTCPSLYLPYLTSLSDIDIKETIAHLPADQVTTALQVMLTQTCVQDSWVKLKKSISRVVRRDPSNTSNVLAGTITYFLIQDVVYKNKTGRSPSMGIQDDRIRRLERYRITSNFDRIVMAYYWMRLNRLDLVKECFEDVTLSDELECFIMLKGLMIFPLHHTFNMYICNELIMLEDTAKLAAKLAFFQPTKYEVLAGLLLEDRETATDKLTQFVVYTSCLTGSYQKILDIVEHLQIPDEELKQVCLNLHHAGEDALFYTTFLALSNSAIFDLIPMISCRTSSDSKANHVTHAVMSFLRLNLVELIPALFKRISEKGFIQNNLSKDEWIMRVLKVGDNIFRTDDYETLLPAMSTQLRAKLLKMCCDETRNFDFLQQIIVMSYEDETLHLVLANLLKLVGTLGASDYIDDCLIHTCPNLPGVKVLSLIRYLADHHVINTYQRNLWMVVGYEKKGDCLELLQNIIKEELYPTNGSIYFSATDIQNLLVLVDSDWMKNELEVRLNHLHAVMAELSEIIKTKNIRRLHRFKYLSFDLLSEDNSHYKIAKRFGIHTAVCVLQSVSEVTKNNIQLAGFLRQIEENRDEHMLMSFVKYYGFLLPRDVKLYGESILRKQGKIKESLYRKVTETQLYMYSYCMYMPIDETLLDLLGNLKDDEIAHLLLIQCVLYANKAVQIWYILETDKYWVHLSKSDRKLLKWILPHAEHQMLRTAKSEESSEVEMNHGVMNDDHSSLLKFEKIIVADQLRLFDERQR